MKKKLTGKVVGLWAAAMLVMAAFSSVSFAQVGGISYSLTPTGNYMIWNKESGLNKGFLYGGQVGFGFGRYVELHGQYMLSQDVKTNLRDMKMFRELYPAGADLPAALQSRDVSIEKMGGNIQFNLGGGAVIPYLNAGAGVIRFEPGDRSQNELIYIAGGGGLNFNLDGRVALKVGVENTWYRHNPATMYFTNADLAELGMERSDFGKEEVGNWAVTAGLSMHLGGRNPNHMSDLDRDLQRQFTGGFSGLSLVVEPMAGVIKFHDDLAYRGNQRMAGINAGFDFGPYVGLRGFYWRGIEEDEWSKFEKFAMYGGEMKFRLNDAATGLVPYLSLGAGYLDVGNDYQGREGRTLTDQPFATGGAGIELKLSDYVKLYGSARAILISSDDVLEDLSTTDNIYNSFMYSAGVSFGLGGKSRPDVIRQSDADRQLSQQREEAEKELSRVREEMRVREQFLAGQLDRAYDRGDSLSIARLEQEIEDARLARDIYRSSNAQNIGYAREMVERDQKQKREQPMEIQRKPIHQTIELPVLEDGEIYIRFGKTGTLNVKTAEDASSKEKETVRETFILNGSGQQGIDAAQLREMIRSILNETRLESGVKTTEVKKEDSTQEKAAEAGKTEVTVNLDQQGQAPPPVVDEKALEDRIVRRLDSGSESSMAELQRQIGELSAQIAAISSNMEKPAAVSTPAQPAERVRVDTRVAPASDDRLNLNGISATAGFNLAGEPFQFLIGARADYGHVWNGRLNFVPDITLGLGKSTSYNINMNFLHKIRVDQLKDWEPYVGFGGGLLLFNDPPADVNGVQLTLNLLAGAERPLANGNAYFVEYVNMNLFNFNRVQAGYRFRFAAK